MAKKLTIADVAAQGFEMAKRPQGVLRSDLAAKWTSSSIGWKKYLDQIAAGQTGVKIAADLNEDGYVFYKVITAKKQAAAKKAAAASRVSAPRKTAKKAARKARR